MISLQFSKFSHTPSLEQAHLMTGYSSFLRLTKNGFPAPDARKMSKLSDDELFEKAKSIYQKLANS